MLITATVRTGNEPAAPTRTGPPVGCGPCGMAHRVLGDAQPFHLTAGVIGVVAAAGLALALFGFSRKPKRR